MTDTTTQLKAGTPCWVDLGSDDLEASLAFYSELFGWETEVAPGPPEQTGNYTFLKIDGKMACAASQKMNPEMPTVWHTYIKTDDADATAQKIKEAGGQTMMEPFDVMDAGRMAVFADPTGAVFSIWQPGRHPGGEIFNVPGALSWNELNTRDPDAAKRFYAAVFGWQGTDHDMDGMVYTEWKLGDSSIGGMFPMGDQIPAGVPPHWLVYFTVADCDEAVAKTERLGGTVMVPARDIPAGRFSVLRDPQGAVFAVIQLASQEG